MTQDTSGRRAYRTRQIWIDDLHRRRDVSLCEKLVGTRLAMHQNLKTGACFPSVATLADETGIPERSVYRALDSLKRKGRIRVQSGGRGRANQYFLIPPTPDKASGVPLTQSQLTPCQANKTPSEEALRPPPPERWERAERPSAVDPPSPGAGGLDGPAPEEDQQGVPSPSAEIQPPPRSKPAGYKESFDALRRVWARPWADADDGVAFRLYCAACGEVGHDAILEAALAWVGPADAPRFLPSLTKWLQARGWEKPPPQKAPAKTPRGAHSAPPRHARPKRGAAYAMFMAGQED